MLNHDLHNRLHFVPVIGEVITDTTDQTAVVVDMQDYSAVEFVIHAFGRVDATLTLTPTLEESDVDTFGGEENDVADADLLGTEALATMDQADADDAAAGAIRKLGYVGNKRFLRLVIANADNDDTIGLSVVAVFKKKNRDGEITDTGQDG